MRKTFIMEELDCANCAAKMEAGIQQIDGVESASISFLTQKLTISAPEDQMSLADLGADQIRKMLLSTDLNSLTPIEAMNLLYELQRKAKS